MGGGITMKQIILKVKDETHKAARIKALMLDKSLMQIHNSCF